MEPISSARSTTPLTKDVAEVCTLSPEGLAERLAWIRREILPYARRSERLLSGIAWELDAAPGLAAKLDRLVALERECCDGIVFEHGKGVQPGRLRLEVRGVNPDAEAFRSLLTLPPESPDRGGRVVKAAGIGLLASLAICCALPLALSVIVGGAAAAALTRLDDPLAIGLGTIALGAAAWWWLARRAERSSRCGAERSGCGPSC